MIAISPIEALMEKAFGNSLRVKETDGPDTVLMRCPQCGKEKVSYKHFSDPENTSVVEALCNKCGPAKLVRYFDKNNQELTM